MPLDWVDSRGCQDMCGFVLAWFQIALTMTWWPSDYCLTSVWAEALWTPWIVKVCQTWGSTALQVTTLDVGWGCGRQRSDFSMQPERRRQSVIRKYMNITPSIPRDRKGRNSHNCEHHTPSKDLGLLTTCSSLSFYLRKTLTVKPRKKRNIGWANALNEISRS